MSEKTVDIKITEEDLALLYSITKRDMDARKKKAYKEGDVVGPYTIRCVDGTWRADKKVRYICIKDGKVLSVLEEELWDIKDSHQK